jgi:serine beta-lactamase-like protein LACTB
VKKIKTQTWIMMIVVAIGLVPIAVLGIFMYASATAPVLHPRAEDVSSIVRATPAQRWNNATEQSRQIVRASLAEQNLPGLSVAVGLAGEIVWAEGFGWSDLEKKVPVSPDLLFRIGTASTVFTSAAAGLLIEQQQLKLDQPIQTYVPEFPVKEWPVTLRQVMAHTAGIRSDSGDEGPMFGAQCDRTLDALPHFANDALRFQPDTEYRFSNYSWILVSAAIEAAADQPFLSFMRKQVFEPLGMDDTRADSATAPVPDQATFYFPRFGGDPRYGPDIMRPLNYSCYAGASAFLSTPTDMVRFAMAINSGKLLQPATVQLLQASQKLSSGQDTGYGLGWDLETATVAGKETRVVGHDGDSLGGMVTSLLTFPEHGIVVAVTSNISYADTFGIGVKIADAFARAPR